MLPSTLLLATAVPMSQSWSPVIAIIMVVANVIGLAAAANSKVKAGPTVGPLTMGQAIGGTCFGHILGAGSILGLTAIGVI